MTNKNSKFAKINVLIRGYDKEFADYDVYTCTSTLIRDGGNNIVVDPGSPKKGILKKALKNQGLELDDINYIFTTHYHTDHARDRALFPNAKQVDIWGYNVGDRYYFESEKGFKITQNVSVIPTPGHAREHSSLIVKTVNGIVVIAGDVWWYKNFTPKIDPYAVNQHDLEKSRKKILEMADYVIPGHGDIVKVKK